jgi:hypothetical protein
MKEMTIKIRLTYLHTYPNSGSATRDALRPLNARRTLAYLQTSEVRNKKAAWLYDTSSKCCP